MNRTQDLSIKLILVVLVISLLAGCDTGQVPDKSYKPVIANPAYQQGAGPLVCLDEAHNNFHTLDGRFWVFGELLRSDGYVVKANKEKFTAGVLQECRIMVIANAQLDLEGWDSYPYPTPSGFTDEEISAVQMWVQNGGSLLLIADHMPLALLGWNSIMVLLWQVSAMKRALMQHSESRPFFHWTITRFFHTRSLLAEPTPNLSRAFDPLRGRRFRRLSPHNR